MSLTARQIAQAVIDLTAALDAIQANDRPTAGALISDVRNRLLAAVRNEMGARASDPGKVGRMVTRLREDLRKQVEIADMIGDTAARDKALAALAAITGPDVPEPPDPPLP